MADDSTEGIPLFLLKDEVVESVESRTKQFAHPRRIGMSNPTGSDRLENSFVQQPDAKLFARLRKSDKIAKALLAYYEKGNPVTFAQKHESMVRALMAVGISDV